MLPRVSLIEQTKPMAYSTVAQFRSATGMGDSTLIPDAYIELRINAADDLINDKIADVYQLPLASTPNLINFISIEIASAFIYMSEFGEEIAEKGIDPQKKLKMMTSILEDIQLQKTKIRDANGAEFARTALKKPVSNPNSGAVGSGTEPVFSIDQQF